MIGPYITAQVRIRLPVRITYFLSVGVQSRPPVLFDRSYALSYAHMALPARQTVVHNTCARRLKTEQTTLFCHFLPQYGSRNHVDLGRSRGYSEQDRYYEKTAPLHGRHLRSQNGYHPVPTYRGRQFHLRCLFHCTTLHSALLWHSQEDLDLHDRRLFGNTRRDCRIRRPADVVQQSLQHEQLSCVSGLTDKNRSINLTY